LLRKAKNDIIYYDVIMKQYFLRHSIVHSSSLFKKKIISKQ